MKLNGRSVIITGGGSGIGAALARAAATRGARVCVTDLDADRAAATASEIGGLSLQCDVTVETQIVQTIAATEKHIGPVDIFVSNAGIVAGQGDHAASAPDAVWTRNWEVHVMAHVWAARALLPGMIGRGSGHLVSVASAAGLLNQIGDAAYSATKHAAVSFAESLAISHGHQGVGVSVVCPQYVATPLIGLSDEDATGSLLTAAEVAEAIVEGVERDQFMILSHPAVAGYAQKRAQDSEGWIRGMQKLRQSAEDTFGGIEAQDFYKLV
jgi:NAD(P)-dependent dehydrogenase (short-subunit alcohol dehydrogenase family)